MAFASSTAAQRLAARDSIVNTSKLIERAVETGSVDSYSAAIDVAGPATVAALQAAGAASGSTTAVVASGTTAVMKNSLDATVGGNGTITVAGGVVTKVTAPAATALIITGNYTVPVTTVTAKTAGQVATVAATITVSGGVITAISIA